MAPLVATPITQFPTLGKALEIQSLHQSTTLYNKLPGDSDQSAILGEDIHNLGALFTRHNADKVFGIHLIHGHFQIPAGTVMLGTNFENPKLRWTKATEIESVDIASVHGHIFVLTEGGLCAYELQRGPLPDLSGVGHGFLTDFVNYIIQNNLTSLIGLRVLGCCDDSMLEIILDHGTVMLDSSIIKNTLPTRTTGWSFKSANSTPLNCQANEVRSRIKTGNHGVFNAGKPHPKLENVEDLRAALVEAGVL